MFFMVLGSKGSHVPLFRLTSWMSSPYLLANIGYSLLGTLKEDVRPTKTSCPVAMQAFSTHPNGACAFAGGVAATDGCVLCVGKAAAIASVFA